MGTYRPLPQPAPIAQPAPMPSPLEQYGRLMQIGNAMQDQQLRQQQMQTGAIQQQVAQIGLEEAKQGAKDNQAFRAAMSDPANKGKTFGDMADVLGHSGNLSLAGVVQLKKADVEARQATAALSDTQLKARQAGMGQLQELYNNVQDMPDDQVASNWGNIAQQYDSIMATIPQTGQQPPQLLNPNQPMTKQQLSQFGPMISMGNAYLDQETARRKAQTEQQTAEVELQGKKAQAAYYEAHGGAPGVTLSDTDKFVNNWLQKNGLPDTPQNRLTGQQEYIKETKINPAQVRVEGYAETREMPVMDTQNGNALQYLSAADINKANQNQPGRYIPASEGSKALTKTATIEDIRGNIQAVRQSLSNPKMPEFTADQRMAISLALGGNDPTGALSNAMRGGVLGSLTPEQQDYLVNMAQLKENAMAMRSVLGAGQGSEDLRNAIAATIPGPRTPSKVYAGKQLDAFENVLNRLEKGIPKVPLANSQTQSQPVLRSGSAGSQNTPKIGDIKTFPNGKQGKWDGQGWVAQ